MAKAFFYFDAIGSAYAWAMPVLQKQLELAMRNGPKLDNTVYVDDGRAMNPNELILWELYGDAANASAQGVTSLASVQPNVVSRGFDPLYFVVGKKNHAPAGPDQKAAVR